MKKLVAVMMLGSTLMPAVSRADFGRDYRHDDDRRGSDHRWHPTHEERPYHPIHEEHRGSWTHSYHNGHLGWWFVLAGAWYAANRAAYDAQSEPVVIEQPTPVTVISPPASAPVVYQAPPAPMATMNSPYWYYCRSSNSYYPYVSGCAEGWQQVAAQPVQ